jgi:hypothetical protein
LAAAEEVLAWRAVLPEERWFWPADDSDDGYVLIIEAAPGAMYAHIWVPAPYYTEFDARVMAVERAIEHSTTTRLLHRGVELARVEIHEGQAITFPSPGGSGEVIAHDGAIVGPESVAGAGGNAETVSYSSEPGPGSSAGRRLE